MPRAFHIRNWSKFQHYKERNPPWIKLHVEILASEDWVMLDDASKLLAVVCMVIAARNDGLVPDSPDYIRRVAYLKARPNLGPLIECGFLLEAPVEASGDASGCKQLLADASESKQAQANARPEKEAEAEKETERISSDPPAAEPDQSQPDKPDGKSGRKTYPAAFEAFWRDYPTDPIMSKSKALEKWNRLTDDDRLAAMAAVPAFRIHCARNPTYRPLHAERFLAQRRFEGLNEAAKPTPVEDAGLRAEWGGRADPLVDAIGAAKFTAWFSGAEFVPGPPQTLRVAKAFAAQWIAGHYAGDLKRLYGEIKIEVKG